MVMTLDKKITDYMNGNVHVTLYEDGTRLLEYDELQPVIFEFPSSMDVKITNKCMGIPYDIPNGEVVYKWKPCEFCHEQSSPSGKHGDLFKLLDVLSPLNNKGIELAIGGGNPLEHPDIKCFLQDCEKNNFVCNLTVNFWNKNGTVLQNLMSEKLVYGLGVSIPVIYPHKNYINQKRYIFEYPHTVAHLILGLHTPEHIEKLMNEGVKKFLLLGYKTFGRGETFFKQHQKDIEENIMNWNKNMMKIITSGNIISFDNLALEQTSLKEKIPSKLWETCYQGNDFTHSMYIDAVNEQYAPTSRSQLTDRVGWDKMNIMEYFGLYSQKVPLPIQSCTRER
jgi:organic radical activating enzyme